MATVLDGASLTVTTATDCPNDAGLHPRVSRPPAVSPTTSSSTTLGLEPPYCHDKYRSLPHASVYSLRSDFLPPCISILLLFQLAFVFFHFLTMIFDARQPLPTYRPKNRDPAGRLSDARFLIPPRLPHLFPSPIVPALGTCSR